MKDDVPKFPVPPASETAREKARHRAMIAYRNAGESPARSGLFALMKWAVALALVVFGATIFFVVSPRDDHREEQLLAQMKELFGPSLSALVEKNGQIEIQSDPDNHYTGEQALMIVVSQAGEKSRILGFSGRDIEIPVKGGIIRVDPLVTGEGDILLVGENFVIRNAGSENGVRFQTQRLEAAL